MQIHKGSDLPSGLVGDLLIRAIAAETCPIRQIVGHGPRLVCLESISPLIAVRASGVGARRPPLVSPVGIKVDAETFRRIDGLPVLPPQPAVLLGVNETVRVDEWDDGKGE